MLVFDYLLCNSLILFGHFISRVIYILSCFYEHQAISMDSKYACGFRLKGQFLLSSNHPEQAVIAFFQAKSLETSIASFEGSYQQHK